MITDNRKITIPCNQIKRGIKIDRVQVKVRFNTRGANYLITSAVKKKIIYE